MLGSGSFFLRFSRDTVLATNGMVALAKLATGEPVDVGRLAATAGAEVAEMRSVVSNLERAGLIESAGGNGSAALRLRRKPGSVSLYDVASAVGEDFEVCRCAEHRGAARHTCVDCALEDVSRHLKADVIALFKSRTVGQLAGSPA
jgi:Rrf2 family protein